MANALYPIWKSAILQASANSALTGTVKAALIDTGVYTYNVIHDFWDDASAAVVGTPQSIANHTYVGGVFDVDDVVFTAVSGASVEAIIIYIDTGVAATSRLVAYLDTGVTGLPVTPNGGNISIAWNASGIFGL